MGIFASLPLMCCCACQALTCACSMMSCCLQSNSGISYIIAKLIYIILLGASVLLAFLLKFTSNSWGESLGPFAVSIGCTSNTTATPGYDYSVFGAEAAAFCAGDAAVYRISFALSLFYLTIIPLAMVSEGLFKGFWGLKILAYGGAMLGCFFLPESVFSGGGFQWVARIASYGFLVLQVLILIDFAYTWNEQWVERAYDGTLTEYDEPKHKHWLVMIIISAFILYGITIAGISLEFIYYANTCSDSQAFIAISLILIAISIGISLFRQQLVGVEGAILPSAVVATYATYLTWSALQSNPDPTCRPTGSQTSGTIFAGIAIAALSLMFTAFRATKNTQHLMRGEETEESSSVSSASSAGSNVTSASSNNNTGNGLYRVEENGKTKMVGDLESNKAKAAENAAANAEAVDEGKKKENVTLFLVLMVTASLYMSMILTNWGEPSDDINGQTGNASMWVKIISAWTSLALYIWTLVAPRVCSGRDFS